MTHRIDVARAVREMVDDTHGDASRRDPDVAPQESLDAPSSSQDGEARLVSIYRHSPTFTHSGIPLLRPPPMPFGIPTLVNPFRPMATSQHPARRAPATLLEPSFSPLSTQPSAFQQSYLAQGSQLMGLSMPQQAAHPAAPLPQAAAPALPQQPPPQFAPPPQPFPPQPPRAPPPPLVEDPRLFAVKRFHDEYRAERAIDAKYRRMPTIAPTDPIARSRVTQLQYVASKFADMDRSAAVLASQYPPERFPDIAAFAEAHSAAAEDGVRSLFIVMSALARPELGEPEMVRAATRALSKDLHDFSSVSGVSATLEEEIEKRESALQAAALRAQRDMSTMTCHICNQVGHIATYCPQKKTKSSKQATTPIPATSKSKSDPPEPGPAPP